FGAGVIAVTAPLFLSGQLTAASQTLLWGIAFFAASAAASAGYLTVSEIVPVEMRAVAIALFYAVGTAIGGLAAPAVFGGLLLALKEGRPGPLVTGYLFGAGLMLFAAATELVLGPATERKPLE